MDSAIVLVQDYPNDLQDFFTPIRNAIEKIQIRDEFRLANLLGALQALTIKKGSRIYHKWRRRQLQRLEELDDYKLTVFERLIKKKHDTVFDRLRAARKK